MFSCFQSCFHWCNLIGGGETEEVQRRGAEEAEEAAEEAQSQETTKGCVAFIYMCSTGSYNLTCTNKAHGFPFDVDFEAVSVCSYSDLSDIHRVKFDQDSWMMSV